MASTIRYGLICLCTWLASTNAQASVVMPQTFTCPLTGTEFEAEIDVSGTSTCSRLDFKELGPISSPALLPVCPDDGLVLYREHFSEAELGVLREWVATRDYQDRIRHESPYYRLAEIMKLFGETRFNIAEAYLQASWEVEGDKARHHRYLRQALTTLREHDTENPDHHLSQYLQANILRVLGEFDAARQITRRLLTIPREELGVEPLQLAWVDHLAAAQNADHVPKSSSECDTYRNYPETAGAQ